METTEIAQRINASLKRHQGEWNLCAEVLISAVTSGLIESKESAQRFLDLIEFLQLEAHVEPLWRSLRYKLYGDGNMLICHPFNRDMIDDVLPLLKF